MPLQLDVAVAVVLYLSALVLPGLATLSALRVGGDDRIARIGLAVGVGFALQPLVYLWARWAGVPVGAALWWPALAGCGAWLALRGWRQAARRRDGDTTGHGDRAGAGQRRDGTGHGDQAGAGQRRDGTGRFGWWAGGRDGDASSRSDRAAAAVMVAMALAVLAARWWAARDLVATPWGDGVQHSMIVRLFQLQRGLPSDWQPLVPLATFTYHFGLHASAATLASLVGWPAERALLLAGQALSVAQVLTLYAFATCWTSRRWAGVGAGLAAAGLSTMPAWYLNWGRYTQLAGQVALPAAALAVAWAATAGPPKDGPLRAPPSRLGRYALAVLLVAGLALTHYLVTVFLALFAAAWLAVGAPRPGTSGRGRAGSGGERPAGGMGGREALVVGQPAAGPARSGPAAPDEARRVGRVALRLAVVALSALALTAPWLSRLRGSVVLGAAGDLATGRLANPDAYGVVAPSFTWGQLDLHVGWGLAVAAALGAAWGMAVRDRTVLLGVAWTAAMVIGAYPALVGLPVTGILKDFTVAIALYVPGGLIIGGALGDAADRVTRRGGRAVSGLTVVALVVVAALAWKDRDPLVPGNVLLAPPDARAMAWIEQHTPDDAVFLVSCGPAYADTVCAGEDAGWWLALLTGRRSTVPPLNYALETPVSPGYRERVNILAALWRDDLDAPSTRAALVAAGVTHAYVGTRPGTLDRAKLAASPFWSLVYDDGGVQVFAGPHAGPHARPTPGGSG